MSRLHRCAVGVSFQRNSSLHHTLLFMNLGKELEERGFDEGMIERQLQVQGLNGDTLVSEMSGDVFGQLVDMLVEESKLQEDVQNHQVAHVFAYGTMRADFSPSGDRWGMVDDQCVVYKHAFAWNFRLYQEQSLFYPYAVWDRNAQDTRLYGTLLHWQDPNVFAHKMKRYDSIEGYNPEWNQDDVLYQRSVVDIFSDELPNGSVKAYIYHQRADEQQIKNSKYFPHGDWLAHQTE